MKHKLRDATLIWLYKKYLEERNALPESQRVGFRVWCKRWGILTPAQQQEVARIEVPLKDTGYSEDDNV